MTKSPESDRKGEQPAKHTPAIVSPQAWEAARQQLLVKEKAQMRRMTRSPPNAGGCRGWPWKRHTRSTGRPAR